MEDALLDPSDAKDNSCTITVFKLKTLKGAFEIVWVGESNGFYDESVDVSFTQEAA